MSILNFFEHLRCGQCGKKIYISVAIKTTEEIFCSETCMHNWLIDNPEIRVEGERDVEGIIDTEDEDPPTEDMP